ncbi:low temperature requirement protein A [Acetobacter oryzifermentans]|uniref:low temperature requirement protein A n=1 Tax=Acetobacter oryzifermentans TaxID=1633874 RepID=UPI001FD72A2F|nr:low temperature requirement protein A [Acetobacter oryzifermentans]
MQRNRLSLSDLLCSDADGATSFCGCQITCKSCLLLSYKRILGRSYTSGWTISGSHLVERCQLFVMVALGETSMASGLYIARAAQWTMPILLGFFIFLGLGQALPSLVLCCVGTLLLLSVAWSVGRSNRA